MPATRRIGGGGGTGERTECKLSAALGQGTFAGTRVKINKGGKGVGWLDDEFYGVKELPLAP